MKKVSALLVLTLFAVSGFASLAPSNVNPLVEEASAACITTAPPTTFGQVTQSVSVPTAGTYRVWSRIKVPNTTANSYWFKAGNSCTYNVGDSSSIPANTWTWVNYQDGSTAAPINVTLTAGTHTFVYTGKEADVQLDKVMLLVDTSCVPTGYGDNCAVSDPGTGTASSLPVTSVTASNFQDPNIPANTRDNNLATRWSACGTAEWIQYDLGAAKSVSSVKIAFGFPTVQQVKFSVAVSSDNSTWTTLLSNQMSTLNNENLQTFNFTATSARYVRIIGHGNTNNIDPCWTSLTEVQIWGATVSAGDITNPTVSLTAPAAGSSAAIGSTVTISANASDNVGVSRVEFWVGSTLMNTDTTSPYSYSWNTAGQTAGAKSLTAKAYDAVGNVATSSAVSINLTAVSTTDTIPPTVSLTAPAAGSSAAVGSTVTISANASDNVGVSRVEFFNGSTMLSSDTSSPYSLAWNTAGQTAGAKSLTARAYDAAGNATTSAALSITLTTTTNTGSGDVNGDGRVNALDLSALLSNDGQNYPAADFNNDGTVGAADMAILLSKWTW